MLKVRHSDQKIMLERERNVTNFAGIGIGEEIHEKMNGTDAEALIIRRQSPLQFLIINKPAPILISQLETRYDAGIRTRRELRGHQGRERAPVRPSGRVTRGGSRVWRPVWWSAAGGGGGEFVFFGGFDVVRTAGVWRSVGS